MAKFNIEVAERKQASLRLAVLGASGSGKTYSSLLLARGLVGDNGSQVIVLDSERGSSRLYSDLFTGGFHVMDLPDHSPQTYTEAIKFVEKQGYKVVIIDSLSHAWIGEGGLLDKHGEVTKKTKNSFSAWREVTPLHNRLVETILQSPAHIIVTLRAKTAYEMVEDERGRKVPRKIGLAPEFRSGIEFEFTTFLELDHSNDIIDASKDRTQLFNTRTKENSYFKLSEEDGKKLAEWLNGGVVQESEVVAQQEVDNAVRYEDSSTTKPFEEWITERIQDTGTVEELKTLYTENKDNITSEINQKIKAKKGMLEQ